MTAQEFREIVGNSRFIAKRAEPEARPPHSEDADRDVLRFSLNKTICLIEEQTFIRHIVKMGITSVAGFDVLTYSDVTKYINDLAPERCELILFRFDETTSAEVLDRLTAHDSNIPVLVFGPPDPRLVVFAKSCGAKGYVTYSSTIENLIDVVRLIIAGGTYAPLELFDKLVSPGEKAERDSRTLLTPREISVVQAIKQGKQNKTIAYSLNVTESTVKSHVRHVLSKLKVKSRMEIALMPEHYIYGLWEDRKV